ncbi:DUF4136 domain-containing protein [Flavitalea sp.]|nr:DUF4136 domain-containing protein [Flavitalea sp.]
MRIKIALSLFLVVMLAGCYKEPAYEELSDNFTVTTNRDLEVDFGTYKTYFISDTVPYHSGTSKDSMLPAAEAKKLVDAVKANMSTRGYTFVPKAAKPDLGVSLGALKDTDVGVIYPGWWYGYPGWWGGGYWGGYYPYYPYSITYVITSGNVIVDIVDLKSAVPKQKLVVIWNAFIGGGLATSTTVNIDMAIDAIDQAFVQSKYIQSK